MRASVLHYHLTIDVAGLIGNQEAREIGEFVMLSGATERITLRPAFIAPFGTKLARSARGRKRAGRDRDRTHTLGPHSTARLLVIASTADLAIDEGTV